MDSASRNSAGVQREVCGLRYGFTNATPSSMADVAAVPGVPFSQALSGTEIVEFLKLVSVVTSSFKLRVRPFSGIMYVGGWQSDRIWQEMDSSGPIWKLHLFDPETMEPYCCPGEPS